MSIKDWPEGDRPREKLLTLGPQVLTDTELLAIFLRTGCAGKSAVDLARDLLTDFGGLRPLIEAKQQDYCSTHGLGPASYASLQAVLEMARRHLAEGLEKENVFTCSATVKDYLRSQLRHKTYEAFCVLYLDSQHQLIRFEEAFRGTIGEAVVYPREIVKRSLALNAAAAILAHNHPSGKAEPSEADRLLTEELKKALALVDVMVLDHMVVGDTEVVSFAERGWLGL